jgi:phosphoserine phosphatase
MVVFDMDGVLVEADSSWQFVHRKLNVDNSRNFTQFLDHQISYREFMEKDIDLWGSPSIHQIRSILDEIPLMRNAESTVTRLKKAGCTTAIISSGISLLADRVQQATGIDIVRANKVLANQEGVLTGKVVEVVDLLRKEAVLRNLASEQHTPLQRCAVVGDSIFDIPMFRAAELSIAFNTHDKRVKEAADVVVEGEDLGNIVPHLLLGE